MKPDKKDCLKQKDGRESGKFRIKGHYVPKLGLYTDESFVFSLIWKETGKVIHNGSWGMCIKIMNNLIRGYKESNGKPHSWQFIGPVSYYNAMDQYIARQKEQIAAEQKK